MALLFVYVRRRVGEWLALAGVLPILFLGPAWDDLLFPFQISFFGSVGLRDRRPARARSRGPPRRPDRLRAAGGRPLLLRTSGSRSWSRRPSTSGSPASGSGARSWSRFPTALWFALVPRLGPRGQNFVSFHNFSTMAGYVADGFALEPLDPARARRPARRDGDHLARLGAAAARARGRRGGLADLAGGFARAAAAALGGAGARAHVLVADRPQRLLPRPGDGSGATSTWG